MLVDNVAEKTKAAILTTFPEVRMDMDKATIFPMNDILPPQVSPSLHADADASPQASRRVLDHLDEAGFCFVSGKRMESLLMAGDESALSDWQCFQESWNCMPRDNYMADGGSYRYRRHATLSAGPGETTARLERHQPHYQGLDYNALNGGIARHYDPISAEIIGGKTMSSVFALCLQVFGRLSADTAWHIEVHQFRIEATAGQAGMPTPEGVHRDGVNFVLVMMVKRSNIASGTTTIHDLDRNRLDKFTLTEPFDAALVNDERCMHGVTPVMPLDPGYPAHRDVLVVTLRRK